MSEGTDEISHTWDTRSPSKPPGDHPFTSCFYGPFRVAARGGRPAGSLPESALADSLWQELRVPSKLALFPAPPSSSARRLQLLPSPPPQCSPLEKGGLLPAAWRAVLRTKEILEGKAGGSSLASRWLVWPQGMCGPGLGDPRASGLDSP